jgi:dolichol-phosphate mannosyltransferase
MAHLSVVIPVYKAEKCLEELHQRLTTSLKKITKDYEIVLVEDRGGDRSWEIISQLARKDKRIKAIQFSRNFGQHFAITAGLDHCDGDWVVVMDCDLQDRPEEIIRLYNKAQEGHEIVLARRAHRQHSFIKRLSSWFFFKIFNYLSDMNYDGRVGNFSITSRKVIDNLRHMREKLRLFGGLVKWMGFPSVSIDVEHDKSHLGGSTYTWGKLLSLAFNIIVAYSDEPLRLMIQCGFIMSFGSFLIGLYIIFRRIYFGISVAGWGSLIVSLYFIGGIIIGFLGIIGIYVGKTFDETKKRPLYFIQETRNVP